MNLGTDVYVGMVVTSHRYGVRGEGQFDRPIFHAAVGTNRVPVAARNLAATPVSPTQVNLSWTYSTTNVVAPVWIEFQRSTDGNNFEFLNGDYYQISEPSTFLDARATPGTHYWYRIRITDDIGTSPWSNLAEATAPATEGGLPSPWQQQTIDGASGSGNFSNGVFYVRGSGADIWGSSDAFEYVFQPRSGDVTILAQIDSIRLVMAGGTQLEPWAKAGLMIRETLSPEAKHALVFLTPQHGSGFQWRTASSSGSEYSAGSISGAPLWLKLTRTGNVFSAYWSPDDHSWVSIGSTTIDMSGSFYVGLAVTSHADGVQVVAPFANVNVTGGGGSAGSPAAPGNVVATPVSANQITVSWIDHADNELGLLVQRSQDGSTFSDLVTLPANTTSYQDRTVSANVTYWYQVRAFNSAGNSAWSGVASATTPPSGGTSSWTYRDIGNAGVPGSASVTDGPTFNVNGSGEDIWERVDSFLFLYQQWVGDGEIMAQVMSLEDTNPWAKAGVMFRESLDAGAPNALMVFTPWHGVGFQSRSEASGLTTFAQGPGSTSGWLRLTRAGNVFTGYMSNDGIHWYVVGSQSIPMGTSIFVGLAVTSHNNSVLNHAQLSNVTLRNTLQ